MFEQRVLAVSEDVMFKWRLLVEQGRKAGHTFSQPDLNIAATGLHHGLTVVSRDATEFEMARVPCLSPWQDAALADLRSDPETDRADTKAGRAKRSRAARIVDGDKE